MGGAGRRAAGAANERRLAVQAEQVGRDELVVCVWVLAEHQVVRELRQEELREATSARARQVAQLGLVAGEGRAAVVLAPGCSRRRRRRLLLLSRLVLGAVD